MRGKKLSHPFSKCTKTLYHKNINWKLINISPIGKIFDKYADKVFSPCPNEKQLLENEETLYSWSDKNTYQCFSFAKIPEGKLVESHENQLNVELRNLHGTETLKRA